MREKHVPPAEQARIAAGYGGSAGLKRMAKRLRRGTAYCRQLELHGAPFNYAEEAARLLGCSPDVFLPQPKPVPQSKTERSSSSFREGGFG